MIMTRVYVLLVDMSNAKTTAAVLILSVAKSRLCIYFYLTQGLSGQVAAADSQPNLKSLPGTHSTRT